MAVAFIVSLFPFDIFVTLSQEDKLVEYLQVLVLLVGALFALKFAQQLFEKGSKIHGAIFILVMIALLFTAGEEISWGQRILSIDTPERFVANNKQEELTLHNLNAVDMLVQPGYILVGLYGSIAWILQRSFSRLRKDPFPYYIPPWCVSLYFLPTFVFNTYTALQPNHHIAAWSESVELLLYSGVMFMLYSLWMRLGSPIKTDKRSVRTA